MSESAPYLDQIQRLAPELTIHQLGYNHEGLVNDIVIVNGQRIFRFPKSEWARTALRHEAQLLALARQHVEMRLPHFDIEQDDMVSYEMIPGEALLRDDILRLAPREQDRVAETLATFLAQLHTIPPAALDAAQIGPSDSVRTAADWLTLYEDTQRELFPLLMSDAKEWVHRLFAPLMADEHFMDCTPCLVHGDLGAYHILCQRPDCQINGIIDFGTAGTGDPAADIGCLINVYGESFVRRMARDYGAIGDHIERGRFRAGTLEIQWLLGGLRSDDRSWFPVHIGRARDVQPLGSGWSDGKPKLR